jgi:fructoselysine-6-P-deglycase FrlB-like protein
MERGSDAPGVDTPDSTEPTMSIVEQTMRSQRESWREISERVSKLGTTEFPHEPAKRIVLFGVGSSHHAARLTAFALLRDKLRLRVPVIACSSNSIGNDVIPQKGDWVFAFSHRGGTPVTRQALKVCDQVGAFPVLVCGKGAPGAREVESARMVLETVEMERVEPHTASVTGAICAVTSLLMGAKAVEEWDALRSIGNPDLEYFRIKAGEGPTAIVGEWEAEWIAREGALKFMEMARLPVRAYGTEEYFHGPRQSLGELERLWHVSLAKDARNDDLKPDYRIGVFGASPLAWIPALVELQWLALATAFNRGIDPDGLKG